MAQVVQTLDDFGRPAWLVAMVLGFVLFWPIGLTILAYMLWSGRMNCGWHGGRGRWDNRFVERFGRAKDRVEGEMRNFARGAYSSGNKAFDDYRAGRVPLSVNKRLLNALVTRFDEAYLRAQSFFAPYPEPLVDIDATIAYCDGKDFWT